MLGASKGGGVRKLKLDDGAFVYTVSAPEMTLRPTVTSPSERANEVCLTLKEVGNVHCPAEHRGFKEQEVQHGDRADGLAVVGVPAQVTHLPASTAFERKLLNHFVHTASRATSCHSIVQEDVCRMILPMAMENSALLSATLVLSAIHIKTLGSPVQALIADQEIAGLKTASLRRLRIALAQPQSQDLNVILATVRTLCLAEVYDGNHRTKSWRTHFDGARTLMKAQPARKQRNTDDSTDLLRRWFSVTEGLIALTPNSIPTTTFEENRTEDYSAIGFKPTTENIADDEVDFSPCNRYLDEYTGCSIDLSGLLRDVGVTIKVHQHEHGFSRDRTCSNFQCSTKAASLERRIRGMISRDQVGKVVFHSKTASKISQRQALEFTFSNRAYQYAALLHIQRRLFDLPAAHHEVQDTVNMIIGCVEGVQPAEGLSPLAVLTTPVFVAGCEALGHDRARVRRLLKIMHTFLHIPNICRALKMLEKYWASMQIDPSLSWAQFAKLHDYDFLPY